MFFTFCSAGLLVAGCDMSEPSSQTPKESTKPDTQAKPAERKTPIVRVEKPKSTVPESGPKPASGVSKTPAPPVLAGQLSVDKLTYDFGKVEPRQRVKGQYILTNTGKGVLRINRPVKSSCGCTVPTLKTYVLQPGESVPLSVTFSAPDRPGKTTKSIFVTTKSPSKPERMTLRITAEIVKHITVSPEKLQLFIRDNIPSRKITLESSDNQSFRVVGFTSPGNVLNLIYDKDTKAKRHVLTVNINTDQLRKQIRGFIIVRVDHPRVKSVTVNYQAQQPFAAKPATRYFSKAKPGESLKSNVIIVSNFGESFELGQIRSEKGHVKILKTTKSPDGYRIDFALNVPQNHKKGLIRDNLLIDIKGRQKDAVKVVCYARVQ